MKRAALALALTAIGLLLLDPHARAQAPDDRMTEGRALYDTGCSGCHGPEGRGAVGPDGERRGPPLTSAGEAAAYYYLSTGRMPLADPGDTPERKEPAYTDQQIDALVAYVASIGDGPALPPVDIERGDLALGGESFRENCAPCHSAAGAGGALSYGRAAPNLHASQALQVAAAIRTGPGQMPVFDEEVISDDDLDSVVAYVQYLRDPADPGGLPLSRVGPIPEGFVTWVVGVGALVAIVAWIGTRMPRTNGHHDGHHED